MRPPSDFIDQWGLLDKIYGRDGGDTNHRENYFWSLLGMMDSPRRRKWLDASKREPLDYYKVMKKLHVFPGIFVRHSQEISPDVNAWDRMSRDQFQPACIACGYWSDQETRRIIAGHKKRCFIRTTNIRNNGATKENHGDLKDNDGNKFDYSPQMADFTGPEIWGNLIRSTNRKWWKWLILFFFDIEIWGGAVKWKYFPKNNIALNQCLSVLQSLDKMPTPLSVWGEKIMPIEEYNIYILDHLDDFHKEDTMIFLTEMIKDAHASIKERRKRR